MRISANSWTSILVLGAVLLAGRQAQAQTILKTFYGGSAQDEFGYSMRGAGDVNKDGFGDLVVGARWDDNHGTNSGTVTVFNGKTNAVLWSFNGDTQYDHMGTSVSGAGDVDNDGWADFIGGADGDDNHGTASGAARVWSGKTGAVLYNFDGDSPDDAFGTTVSGAGDVNNDGFDDVMVGAPFDDNNGVSSGMVRVYSGKTGAVLYTFNGDAPDDFFGFSISQAGDVNADGFADMIVGAPYADPVGSTSGLAKVFSGKTGAVLYTFKGSAAGDNMGYSVSSARDVNGDGYSDLIVGAPYADLFAPEAGVVKVYSGKTGTVLYTFTGNSSTDLFGVSVSGAGDVNSDGHDDVIVGAIWDDVNGINSGSAKVFSGANGNLMMTLGGDITQVQLGACVSSAGDANGDGFGDLLASSYLDNTGGTSAGLVRLYSANAPASSIYCTGKVNSLGCTPAIAVTGTPKVSGTASYVISCTNVINNKSGLLLYGSAASSLPFHGGTLCVQTPIHRTGLQNSGGGTSGSACVGSYAFDFNAWIRTGGDAGLTAGELVCAQWWTRDQPSAFGDGLSNAVRFTINP
jgi:hypothetical protein